MPQTEFFQLLGKKLSNDITPSEGQKLILLAQQDVNNDLLLNFMSQHKDAFNSDSNLFDAQLSLINFKKRIGVDSSHTENVNLSIVSNNRLSNSKRFYVQLSIAASVIFLIITTAYFYNNNSRKQKLQQTQVITPRGQRIKMVLSDSTIVWVNAETKITYPKIFKGNTREISLEGEAFFDVFHNKEKPFIIHTKSMNIKVLGTSFNVKAYPKDLMEQASLIKGSIEVTFPNVSDKSVVLKPTEKIEVKNITSSVISIKNAKKQISIEGDEEVLTYSKLPTTIFDNQIIEGAFKEGNLVIKSMKFLDLANEFERWFDVNILIENENLKNISFTARFKNENIENALNILKLTYPFSYTYNKNSKTIKIM